MLLKIISFLENKWQQISSNFIIIIIQCISIFISKHFEFGVP